MHAYGRFITRLYHSEKYQAISLPYKKLCSIVIRKSLHKRFFISRPEKKLATKKTVPAIKTCFLISLFFLLLAYSGFTFAVSNVFHVHAYLVFGDGDYDNGLTYKKYGFPVNPPYWHGRFGNGPMSDEYTAWRMGLIPNPLHHPNYNRHRLFLDYAQFLAYIEPQNLLSDKIHGEYGKNFSAITLNQEITEFQNSSDHLYKANTLVLIGVGSNDIYSNNCLKDPLQCISTSTAIMVNQIKRLCRMGFSHFLLATPTYALDAPGLIHYLQTVPNPKQTKSNLKLLVQNYLRQYDNIKLLVQHTFPHAKIIVLYAPVIEEKFTKMFSTPTQTPCYNNGYGYEVYNRQIGPVCPNPNQHVFFDNYFYSSAIQKFIFKIFLSYIT